MNELNSLEARKMNPIERMQKLQRTILEADGRVRLHQTRHKKASFWLNVASLGLLGTYVLYHLAHPNG